MSESGLLSLDGRVWPAPIGSPIEMTERGLVYAGGSVLVRMRKSVEGQQQLAIGADRKRMLALMSVAFRRAVAASDVIPHVETAAEHWRRGEKALANLRLVFAGLAGRRSDPTAGDRVALAAHLLDQGWPPAALLEELGLAGGLADLEKYNPYHVPAGHGDRSGEFDVRPGGSQAPDGAIVVAAGDDETDFGDRELSGETTPKEEVEHGHPITPATGIPVMGTEGGAAGSLRTIDTLSAAARRAREIVGEGKGSVHGTAAHMEFKAQVEALGRDDFHTEQSYLNGVPVKYGTRGSVRADVVHPTIENPHILGDYKTGSARLSGSRKQDFRTHLPKLDDDNEVEIHEIR